MVSAPRRPVKHGCEPRGLVKHECGPLDARVDLRMQSKIMAMGAGAIAIIFNCTHLRRLVKHKVRAV